MSDGNNFVVIGGNGAIGSTLAERLLGAGNKVVATVRDQDEASQNAKLKGAHLIELDATDWDAYPDIYDEAESVFGPIDGVAVCVGSILLKPAHLTSKEDFDSVMSLNVSTCFGAIRSVAKRMMKSGGSIVLCSSAAARHGFPNHDAIAAAKAAVIGLTLSSAATYASYGIRVNCVAPGLVHSKMSRPITGNETALKASQSMHALGRIGEPSDVASAMAWLLDREHNWVSGQTIGIDGGLGSLFSKKR
ncbi:SDR family oxidoreductase [Pelagicoccus sp. SDUM812002]|uniref:SDR family NAD(P)-dependent oxidoreductase n=1 Tax=Pelagicoccus sp. SDUM812002 TaxID=3041266 RepID=UPI00280F5F39|nr:SDR family oxidoreductase [Pelagicoccus sp. SDUM812002]MDQ8187023.1 SDR family oxidoreductase [Pelagicoccus sp. SDUM812002]